MKLLSFQKLPRWWFQICFIFTPTRGRFPFWLIFFNGVENTNQLLISSPPAWWILGYRFLFVRHIFSKPLLTSGMRLEGDPEKGSRLKETLEKWSGFTAWKLRSNRQKTTLGSLVVEVVVVVVVFFGSTNWLVVGESNHSQKLKLSWKGVKSGWSYFFLKHV